MMEEAQDPQTRGAQCPRLAAEPVQSDPERPPPLRLTPPY